jgi:hypothetical protein
LRGGLGFSGVGLNGFGSHFRNLDNTA